MALHSSTALALMRVAYTTCWPSRYSYTSGIANAASARKYTGTSELR